MDAEVVAETNVSAARPGRGGEVKVSDAELDDVLELGWQDGIVELIRAGDLEDHFPQSVRSADGRLSIPTRKTIISPSRGTREINLDFVKQIRVNVTEVVAEKAVEFAIPRALLHLEKRHIPHPGLYRVDNKCNLTRTSEKVSSSKEPYLVLLHGTFSNTTASFRDLFESEDWKKLYAKYADRILAFEHHTVTESPAGNALQLVSELPKDARIHLLSYSGGGFIGDLLCRQAWEDAEIEAFFADPAYQKIKKELGDLRQALGKQQQMRFERFARVAAPAAGTLLASKRLDTYLNVILSIVGKLLGPGAAWFEFLKAIALTIISTRTKANALPGIEAMMPHVDKGFVPFLNCADQGTHDLAVIAGDVRGGGPFDRVKDFFSNLYFLEDNDFVVDSRSMFRGVPAKTARGYFFRGPSANHFSYFAEEETRSRLVEWLIDSREDRLQPLSAAEPYGGLRGAKSTRSIPPLEEIKKQRRELPVAFLLPGIMGTHLALKKKRQWIDVSAIIWGGLGKLAIETKDVEPDGLVESYYEKLFDHLRPYYDVLTFGFDWRKPIAESAKLLAKEIAEELENHTRPVRIIAHSMGGLVARAFVSAHPDLWSKMTRRGGRLIMLGTPNHGSYIPAQVLTQQHKLMKLVAASDLRNSLDDLTKVVRAFPGLVEMLPYKDKIDLLAPERWQGFSDWPPHAGILESARVFRDKLRNSAIDPDHMVYVAGHHKQTPASMERAGSKVIFRYTGRGDGTVPWDLGLLDGVNTYYVNVEHGQIGNHPPAFDAFLELLAEGQTRKLETAPPVVERGAEEELFLPEPQEGEDEIRYFPDTGDFMATIAGRPRDLEKELGPPLLLEVTNSDVRNAKHPVFVGHYKGDPIVSAEAALDRAVDGKLTRDLRLGRYPGSIETARVYEPSDKIRGVVVVGLGDAGTLRRLSLERSLRTAMLEYALENLPEEGQSIIELYLSSFLIGTFGGTHISVDESVATLTEAALETNKLLESQNLASRVRIRGIEIIELYRDIATAAGHASRRVAERLKDQVRSAEAIHIRKESRRSRPHSPYEWGWSGRLRIRADEHGIEYEVTTDMARTEPYTRPIQWSHVDALLSRAMIRDSEAPSTLFQYLLPYQLTEQAGSMPDVVLELDPPAARIPWELLSPAQKDTDSALPLGVRVGILRTLSTVTRRERPLRSGERRALVIGEPAGVVPPLPGALQEAKEVSRLLSQRKFAVEESFGRDPDSIIRALYRYEYDIVHIAAHGMFDEKGEKSGVLLGNGSYLRSSEFENLRAVPSVVFLNCCHLGKLEESTEGELNHLRNPGRLAASVAKTLIEMGVGVVVVAGWAVGDEAAKAFARTLYTALLDGDDLMSATRTARSKTYSICGSADLTWGAYQVYGDPGYVLHWAERRGAERQPRQPAFVSPYELKEHILDFSHRGRGADQARREGLKDELDRLEQWIPEGWGKMGQIENAFGAAYAELGFYPEAIKHYEAALSQSDTPIEAIEQIANMESRAAEKEFNINQRQAIQWFNSSVKRMRDLCNISESSERRSLIGATFNRRAKVMPGRTATQRKARERYIRLALDEYEKACALKPDNLYYPLSQKVVLQLILRPDNVKREDIDKIVQNAEKCDDEWSRVTVAEIYLVKFLAFGEGTPEKTIDTYLEAWSAGAGPSRREFESSLGQLLALLDLVSDKEVRKRAEAIGPDLRSRLDTKS
ncbi:MAG: CHAT domain-containing protein [Candidatus Promineifilaceae bacterium]